VEHDARQEAIGEALDAYADDRTVALLDGIGALCRFATTG
jgi:hypothetical protein